MDRDTIYIYIHLRKTCSVGPYPAEGWAKMGKDGHEMWTRTCVGMAFDLLIKIADMMNLSLDFRVIFIQPVCFFFVSFRFVLL